MKTKFHELSFLDTTSTCSPLEKVKTKGELKSMKSIKREPSIRECFDEISTMVGSLGTPTMARKVGCDKKKTKMDHYMDKFLDELQRYIISIKDVTSDGNRGYRAIATLLGHGEEFW